MNFASQIMRRTTFTLIKNQLYITLMVAMLSYIIYDLAVFLAGLYGGLIAILATLISSWRITRAGNVAGIEIQQGTFEIYLGAIQKYILVLVLFALGMGFLKLLPVPMIVAFSVAQLAYLFINVNIKYNGVSS
jgi:ATP synthase protein I